jgi:hypothetical protein
MMGHLNYHCSCLYVFGQQTQVSHISSIGGNRVALLLIDPNKRKDKNKPPRQGGRNPPSRPPHHGREARRMRARERHSHGWTPQDIVAALGVSEGAGSQGFKKALTLGISAVRHPPPPGVQPGRRDEPLAHGAVVCGFPGAVWTAARGVDRIRPPFGVSSHRVPGARRRRRVTPSQKARQRAEAVIPGWHAERWPALTTRPQRKSERAFVSIRPRCLCCRGVSSSRHPQARRPWCA